VQSSLASPSFVNNDLVEYREFQCNITNHAVQISRLKKNSVLYITIHEILRSFNVQKKKWFKTFIVNKYLWIFIDLIFTQQIVNNLIEVTIIFLQDQQTYITSFNKIVCLPINLNTYQTYD